MKIVVLDGYTLNPGDLSWDPIKAFGAVKVYDRTGVDEIAHRAAGAEILLTNKTPLNRESIRKVHELRYVGVLATGFDVVNVEAARKRGIPVTNVPGYATSSVAEHVFAMLLDFTRLVSHHAHAVFKGRWTHAPDFCFWNYPLEELSGLTLGIIGFGQIGRAVARIGEAFGMRVLACTRTPPVGPLPGVAFCDMNTLLRESDVVSMHCPLTDQTSRMVNASFLEKMKKTAYLINTSRGGVVDEEALALALNQRAIAGAALDVLSEEPPNPKNPLLRARNCSITPHHAWASLAARRRLMAGVAANIEAFLAGRPTNMVNAPLARSASD